ncbi:hypothetical protein [Pedobacter ginsengisoli]|uniref:hypothetical protein n=1 Tax=Pedobacter ginsengisoli TaxID=363852 RepID=UPI00254A24B0|nr:hypothetical protein [Pedobacter ginsengisoli]
MKSLHLNMYKKINYIAAVLILLASISAEAQITTQSPYSRYGLGNIKGSMLPQYRAMGGISTAINKPTLYSNINMQNPASYTGIALTTVDIGMSGAFTTLKRDGAQEKSYNSTLSHLALAFPLVSGKSALSIGILPYTELGYEYAVATKLDTTDVNYRYAGEGGLTKAYIGYGQRIGDNFSIGGNIEYLFGNLQESRSTELLSYPSIPNRQQNKNSVGGVTFSYGMQYQIPLGNKKSLTLGYSGSSSSSVNSKKSYVVTQFSYNDLGEENTAFDTLEVRENPSAKLKLPLTHNFGIAFQKDNKWLIGADYRMGKWSKLSIEGVNQGLQDSWGFSAGGQFIPNMSAISGYFNRVEYRMGFNYDKTYIRISDQDVKQMAVTFGLGLPLASARYSIYKLNLTTEIGKRGSMTNGMLQENYINLHLGFTLNDTWFKRFKFD